MALESGGRKWKFVCSYGKIDVIHQASSSCSKGVEMGVIGNVKANGGTLYELLLKNLQIRSASSVAPKKEDQPAPTFNSFDNQKKLPGFLAEFRSSFVRFQSRLNNSSFLGASFTRLMKTATVSDSGKALAKASGEASEDSYTVSIARLAERRKSLSETLVSKQTTDFDEGTYTFDLTVGRNSYSIDVEIDKSVTNPDSNKDVLRKIANAVSGVDENIEAQVIESKRKDYYNLYTENALEKVSSLSISNVQAGNEFEYSLSDTSGDLIEKLGLDRTRTMGRENQYSVNHVVAGGDSNTVTLDDNRLSVEFLDPTREDKPLSIKVAAGMAALEKELTDVINEYNELVNWLDNNRRFVNPAVKSQLFGNLQSRTLSGNYLPGREGSVKFNVANSSVIDQKLTEIGLTIQTDGSIAIDEEFSKSINRDLKGIYDALAGEQGFFTQIAAGIDEILSRNSSVFVLERSNYLTYDAQGNDKQSIARRGVAGFLDLYL